MADTFEATPPGTTQLDIFQLNIDHLTAVAAPGEEPLLPLSVADYIQHIDVVFNGLKQDIDHPHLDVDLPPDPNDPASKDFRNTALRNVVHNGANAMLAVILTGLPDYTFMQTKMEVITENGPQFAADTNQQVIDTFKQFGQSIQMFNEHVTNPHVADRFALFQEQVVMLTKRLVADKPELATLPDYLQPSNENKPVLETAVQNIGKHRLHLN